MTRRAAFALFVLSAALLLSYRVHAQSTVTYQQLLNAAKEPHNWLTYGGDYFSHRFSQLTQITPANVKSLNLEWVFQSPLAGSWQATPLAVGGMGLCLVSLFVATRPQA